MSAAPVKMSFRPSSRAFRLRAEEPASARVLKKQVPRLLAKNTLVARDDTLKNAILRQLSAQVYVLHLVHLPPEKARCQPFELVSRIGHIEAEAAMLGVQRNGRRSSTVFGR